MDKIRAKFSDNCDRTFDCDNPFNGETLTVFSPISEEKMEELLRASNAKTRSLDPLPSSIVKQCASELAPILCRIVNLSLENAQFPEKYKQAVIRPLLKKPSLDTELKTIALFRILPLSEN